MNETPTLTNDLTSKSYVDSQFETKQNSINDGDLTIARTAGLQAALEGKQNELTTGANITITDDEISCDLTAGTNIDITDGVISTTGLATTTQLGTKQDEITTDTDLTLNSITTDDLIVN